MNITFTCPFCERVMTFPASLEGKHGKCPGCEQSVTVVADRIPHEERKTLERERVSDSEREGRALWFDFRVWSWRKRGVVFTLVAVLGSLVAYVSWPEDMYKNARMQAAYDNQLAVEKEKFELPEGFDYQIVNEDILLDVKRSVDVVVSEPIAEEALSTLAYEIKKQASTEFEKTFIGYYLKTDDQSGAYWATTHFNPNLVVRINGQTRPDTTDQNVVDTNTGLGELLGAWREGGGLRAKLSIFSNGSDHYLEIVYNDGSNSVQKLKVSQQTDGKRFEKMKPSSAGDYWLLKSDGVLELRDNEGLIYNCTPIVD